MRRASSGDSLVPQETRGVSPPCLSSPRTHSPSPLRSFFLLLSPSRLSVFTPSCSLPFLLFFFSLCFSLSSPSSLSLTTISKFCRRLGPFDQSSEGLRYSFYYYRLLDTPTSPSPYSSSPSDIRLNPGGFPIRLQGWGSLALTLK